MTAVKDSLVLGAYVFNFIYALASGSIIRSYFTKCKPLGMQTFLDKMIYHFTIVNTIGMTYVLFLMGFSEPIGPSGAMIAIISAYTFNFLALVYQFSVLSILTAR